MKFWSGPKDLLEFVRELGGPTNFIKCPACTHETYRSLGGMRGLKGRRQCVCQRISEKHTEYTCACGYSS